MDVRACECAKKEEYGFIDHYFSHTSLFGARMQNKVNFHYLSDLQNAFDCMNQDSLKCATSAAGCGFVHY